MPTPIDAADDDLVAELLHFSTVLAAVDAQRAALAALDAAALTPDDVTVRVRIDAAIFDVPADRLDFESSALLIAHGIAALTAQRDEVVATVADIAARLAARCGDRGVASLQSAIAGELGVHPEEMAGRGPA